MIVIVTLTVLMMLYFSDPGFDEISDLVGESYFLQCNIQCAVTSSNQ